MQRLKYMSEKKTKTLNRFLSFALYLKQTNLHHTPHTHTYNTYYYSNTNNTYNTLLCEL
jgi:hypothetical protein